MAREVRTEGGKNLAGMNPHIWRAIALLLGLAGVSSCLGFVRNFDAAGNPAHWTLANSAASTNSFNPDTKSIRYFLAQDAYSQANAVSELNSIRAAFAQWQSVPGTAVRFEDSGLLGAGVDINTSDGTNCVFWAKTSQFVNGGRDNIAGTLALTYRRVTNNNEIVESDIVLNGFQANWFSDFGDRANPAQFIESSVLHEIGHLLGFEHSPVGGATMYPRSTTGVGCQAGLSADEIAAARVVYPFAPLTNAGLSGRVMVGSKSVFGAAVFVESSQGNIEQGTVTRNDGAFDFILPEGAYSLRVVPLDPASANSLARLLTGSDIAPAYAGAQTSFLPMSMLAAVHRLETNDFEIQVAPGNLDFRITRLVTPSEDPAAFRAINAPVQISIGGAPIYVGVCSTSVPPAKATISVTGNDIVVGPTIARPAAFASGETTLNLLYARITVRSNASPGLRSFLVTADSKSSFANGCIEILPPVSDFNFDSLDDLFQRSHFQLFTSDAAAPGSDPDHDGADNASEFFSGTDPGDANSVLKIQSIAISAGNVQVRWRSVPGRVYRLAYANAISSPDWTPVETEVIASSASTFFTEPLLPSQNRFYRIQLVQ
jgi:hypothetical protein